MPIHQAAAERSLVADERPPGVLQSTVRSDALFATAPKLGQHHIAHLRAVAEGIDVVDAARRYLRIEHGHQAMTAHRQAVDLAAAIARRRGDSRWRLLGMALPSRSPDDVPSIEAWAAAEGLDDWPMAELQVLYAEHYQAPADAAACRRVVRDERLRRRRLELLRDLEVNAVEPVSPHDLVDGWLPLPLAKALNAMGILTLGELRAKITLGGRWWLGLPATGPVKAARIVAQVEHLLGPITTPVWPMPAAASGDLSGATRVNRATSKPGLLDAHDDRTAVAAWISARAGSDATVRAYQREAERFMLWMLTERQRCMSDASVEDCRIYMDFLANVPDRWISRRHAPRLAAGWSPFTGQLSVASQRQAVTVIHSMFTWLVAVGYLASNPWALVQRRIGDATDRQPVVQVSRAFTPQIWRALLDRAALEAGTPAGERMRWLLPFAEATGLRAAELLGARRGDFVLSGSAWWLHVRGKGSRVRAVPVPSRAMDATRQYFSVRGIPFEDAPADVPLLASTQVPDASIAYSSLHEAFKAFVRRALNSSSVPPQERRQALSASMHWLRHTHATRAVEAQVPPDVLQANLGQVDPRTTAVYYRAQADRRHREMERVYGHGEDLGGG